ncbi:hypothetical protein ABFY57_12060 [Paenibacillus polymyxa]|uniref:hypothetical protein n=1 Tax=Paenibacillus polymyxa TaxID=1406 RepID=UPI002018FB03|nr:hypothetical protein [Paenibacillus polymyxa]UQQ36182.1 hypothetical protein LMH85_04485 [Paenibacillus polymyxa]
MIQTIGCEVNRAEYLINLIYLREMLNGIIQEGKSLRHELNQIVERYGEIVDFQSTKDVTRFIGEVLLKAVGTNRRKITNEALDSWYEQTKDVFFIKLKNYKRCRDRYKKIATFINSLSITFDEWGINCVHAFIESNLKMATIKPVFRVNKSGSVSMSQPAMPFSITEMMGLLSFNVTIRFKSSDEMVGFLNKYHDIIWGDHMGKRLVVSGEVLYVQMIVSEYEFIPFSDSEDEMKQLIEQFNLEYRNPLALSSGVIIKD